MHDMTPSRGIRNNNPGNIRKSSEPWRGLAAAKDQKDPAFFTFETPEWGIRAMAVILRTYQTKYGLRTIRAIIGRWAPSAENDTDAYVDAGRGIQKKENLPLVEEFAKLLGGVVGASRPLTDLDWLPKTRQVGQSGKTVRPKLYVACGISGAMQHVAGMKDAGLIVAINTDPSAPIFEIAHVGIVGNVLQILPLAIKALKA